MNTTAEQLIINSGSDERLIDTKQFVSGRDLNFDIPRGSEDKEYIVVRVTGTITVGTAPTAYHDNAAARLLNKLVLIADSRNDIYHRTGVAAALGNFERRYQKTLTNPSGTGAQTVECYYFIDLSTIDGKNPSDSILRARDFSKLTLQVRCGDLDASANTSDMVKTAGSFALTSTDLDVEVYAVSTLEFTEAGINTRRFLKTSPMISKVLTASNSNFNVKLPTGDRLNLRGVLVYCYDETSEVADNAVINDIKIQSGSLVPKNLPGGLIRAQNVADMKLADSQLPDGFYWVDLCRNGHLNKLLSLRGRQELDIVFDATHNGSTNAVIDLFPVYYS